MASMLASLSRRERNVNINVGSFSETRKHSDKSRWICIYPAYLNSKKTISDGRQIPAKLAVENPTCNEIRDVLANAGFQVEMELNKIYPRELNKYDMAGRGRLRVQLKNDDDSLVKPEFKDRKAIFLYAAETIPKLKSRGAGGSASASNQSSDQSKSGKKSNKKK